jgi:hypothetical protein
MILEEKPKKKGVKKFMKLFNIKNSKFKIIVTFAAALSPDGGSGRRAWLRAM